MASFIQRSIAPGRTDSDFIHYGHGGNNFCIEIENGSCLPNCVGYCWGRWRELLREYHSLPRCNAEDWYGNKTDGYKRGRTPEKGAVICWRKGRLYDGSDGAGHVAVVEKVKANGDIVTSESAYGGERFRTRTYTKKSGYYLAEGYVFQGFIYIPLDFGYENRKYTPGEYAVTSAVLAVRSGPGKAYSKKFFRKLSADARRQIRQLCETDYDGYVKGVAVTVSGVKGRWGKTASGWISLDHCEKI